VIHFQSYLEVRMAGEFWLSDDQWFRLQPMLPNKPRGVPRVDDRKVISGIVHVLQSGCRWKDAPAIYGPPKTLYNRNVRWAAKGVWRAVFEALAAEGGPPTEVLIDSTHVKAHRSAAGGKGGRTFRRSAAVGAVATPKSTPSPIDTAVRSPSC
jgi:transposase